MAGVINSTYSMDYRWDNVRSKNLLGLTAKMQVNFVF